MFDPRKTKVKKPKTSDKKFLRSTADAANVLSNLGDVPGPEPFPASLSDEEGSQNWLTPEHMMDTVVPEKDDNEWINSLVSKWFRDNDFKHA